MADVGSWLDPPSDWRARLEYIARRQWAGYQAHPWLAQIVSLHRPQLAPRAMMHTEWALAALDGFPVSDTTKLCITLTLFGHVKAAASGPEAEYRAIQDTGVDIEEWVRLHDAQSAPVIQSGRFPTLARIDASACVEMDLGELLEFGLTAFLDGFEKLLSGSLPPAPSAARRS